VDEMFLLHMNKFTAMFYKIWWHAEQKLTRYFFVRLQNIILQT